jgi:hypothetical protein
MRKNRFCFQDLCPSYKGICPAMKNVDGGEFYKKYLLKVSFTGPFNRDSSMRILPWSFSEL